MLHTALKRIYDWQEIAGIELGDIGRIPLCQGLVLEEFGEEFVGKGIEQNSTFELKDAVIDLIWVYLNYTYAMGISIDTVCKAISDTLFEDIEAPIGDKQSLKLESQIFEWRENLTAEVKNFTEETLLSSLQHTAELCIKYTYSVGVSPSDLNEFLRLVETSNYSKFCQTIGEAEQTVEAYKNGTHWDKPGDIIDCYFEQVGVYFVILRKDGKVMKSISYKSLEQLLELV
jgi:hypothetical protein